MNKNDFLQRLEYNLFKEDEGEEMNEIEIRKICNETIREINKEEEEE